MSMSETGNPLLPSSTNCRNASARMIAAALSNSGVTRQEACVLFGLDQDFGDLVDQYQAPKDPCNSSRRNLAFNPRLAGVQAVGCASSSQGIVTNSFAGQEVRIPISDFTSSLSRRQSDVLHEAAQLTHKLGMQNSINRDFFVD